MKKKGTKRKAIKTTLKTEEEDDGQSKEEKRSFECEFCSFKTSISAKALYAHMKVHFDGPPYKCPECDYRHDSVRTLMMHRYKHSKEKKFTCDTCGQKFKFPTALANHMHLHTNDSKFYDYIKNISKFLISFCMNLNALR